MMALGHRMLVTLQRNRAGFFPASQDQLSLQANHIQATDPLIYQTRHIELTFQSDLMRISISSFHSPTKEQESCSTILPLHHVHHL